MKKVLSVILALALAASALTVTLNASEPLHPIEAMYAVLERFPESVDTGLDHVEGTTFMYGIAVTAALPGIFGGAVFTEAVVDQEVNGFLGTSASVLSINDFYQYGQDGVATWEMDLDALTFTINMEYDVYWHDGVPLTLDDLVFAYEIIGSPDYTGPRRTAGIPFIVGFNEFLEGEADHIAGLVLSNDNRTLTKHFTEMSIGMLYPGSLWTAPAPRHVMGDIPVGEMEDSDAVRVTPIGWGPFMVESIAPGESVYMVRNENFVFGAPMIERVVVRRIMPELVGSAMEAGTFDLISFPTMYYADHADPTNFTFLGTLIGNYSYIAFRLGHWDDENGVNVYSPDRLMSRLGPQFRRAMAYAIDTAEITETLFHGLQFPAASNVPPHHRALHDPTVPGFPFDPERAMELLDEIGAIDIDGDGYRECPDGEQLTINWAYVTGPLEDIYVPFHIQAWADVGIRVELWQGVAHDQLFLWDMLDFDADDDEIHIYTGGWSPGANPNPEGAWGHIFWNASRYTSEEYDAILDRMSSEAAWDEDYMMQVFSDWQWYWYENLPYHVTRWTIGLTAINNRVTRWETAPRYSGINRSFNWSMVGLSAENPYSR